MRGARLEDLVGRLIRKISVGEYNVDMFYDVYVIGGDSVINLSEVESQSWLFLNRAG